MNPIFEILKKNGFYKRRKLNFNKIYNSKFKNLIDTVEEVCNLTIVDKKKQSISIFDHTASIPFSGGLGDCAALGCRIERANHLARYSALYSDKVYIHNFLTEYTSTYGHGDIYDSHDLRINIIEDLIIINLYRPFLEKGIINLVTPNEVVCPNCLSIELFGKKANTNFQRIKKSLQKDLKKNLEVSFKRDNNDSFSLNLEGPNYFVEHGSLVYPLDEIPKSILRLKGSKASLKATNQIIIPRKIYDKFDFYNIRSNAIMENLYYQMLVASIFDSTFISDRAIDIDLLTKLSNNSNISKTNSILAENLQTIIPFANDVPLNKILKIRQREEESFNNFRSSFNKAVNEVRLNQDNFSKKDAHGIFSDIIRPELFKLDNKVKQAKKDLLSLPLTAISTIGLLSFGLYTGIIPSELASAAKLFGFTKILNDSIKDFAKLRTPENSVKNENYFFLWKIKKIGENKRFLNNTII